MTNDNYDISNIAGRIVHLSECFSSDKEFLEKCGITNYSFVTDLRKGRVKSPGAKKLAQIVRGTGCSGRWLLTGEGEMFPPQHDGNQAAEKTYLIKDITQTLRLIESLEQKSSSDLKDAGIPEDMPAKLLRLASKLLEPSPESQKKQD